MPGSRGGCAPVPQGGQVPVFPCALPHPLPSVPRLIPAHPALVNAIVLVLHSVAGSTPLPAPDTSSRAMALGSYRDMPGTSSWRGAPCWASVLPDQGPTGSSSASSFLPVCHIPFDSTRIMGV